jgi:hypothetical protein
MSVRQLGDRRDREDLAAALLLWRYVDHTFYGGVPKESFSRVLRATELARKLDISREFMTALQGTPVLSVKVNGRTIEVKDLGQ